MSGQLALRLTTYLVVADGLAALLLARLIEPVGALLVAAAILASWWHERARERGVVRSRFAWGLVGAAAVVLAMDLYYLAASVLDGMVHVLLFVILARLFVSRSLSDLRDAGFLSFFLLVAASSVTFSVGFLGVFTAYLLLATWMLILHHVVAESEQAGRHDLVAARFGMRGQVFRVGLGAAAATFIVAGALFFVIPRVGQAMLPFRTQVSRLVTGFSDHVDLGAFGDIETDKTVVMRVYFTEDERDPSTLPNLRWRGIVFDTFDGRTWSVGRPNRRLLRRGSSDLFAVAAPRGRGPLVKQEIYLDPIGTDIIFAAPRALRADLRADIVSIDDMGSISVPAAVARLHYSVVSELETPPPPGTRVAGAGAALDAAERGRYLQLPPLSPGIVRLAGEVTAGSRDPYEAATRLTRFLSTTFRYSLSKKETALEPLQEFLFTRRSGNCEYFSAALTVMLRSLDIPARVVGGFQRGEWNPYGRYFMVRLSDAHAWVEAHFDGLGWVTFDPSPRAEAFAEAGPGALTMYLDAARMRWYRYVVNWSLQDQRVMVSTVQRRVEDFGLAFTWPRDWGSRRWLAVGGGAFAAVALGSLFWRRRRTSGARAAIARMPAFYEVALRRLERHGLSPEPAETARQFCERAGSAVPETAAPLGRITGAYERARFGTVTLTDVELSDVERCLAELEALSDGTRFRAREPARTAR